MPECSAVIGAALPLVLLLQLVLLLLALALLVEVRGVEEREAFAVATEAAKASVTRCEWCARRDSSCSAREARRMP
jgi:hypothetical protein